MKHQKIELAGPDVFAQYWLQYKVSAILPDYKLVFATHIANIQNYTLGMYYWNVGCVPESKIVGVGGAVRQLTGHSEKEWLGASPEFALKHFYDEDAPYVMAYAMKFDGYLKALSVQEREKVKASIFARVKTADGTLKWFCIQYPGFYYDEEGRLIYVLAVCSNISHIKNDNDIPFMTILDTHSDTQQVFICHKPEEKLQKIQIPDLTKREREIIGFLAKGYSSKQISSLLFISKSTVDNHRQNLLKKLGAASTAEIIHRAVEQGII